MRSNWASLINRFKAEFSFYRAQTLEGAERWKESVIAYEKALALDADNWGLRLQYGLTLAKVFQYRDATAQIEKAESLCSNNSVIPMFLGAVLIEQGSYEEALRSLNRSSDMDPLNPFAFALRGLAMLYCGSRDQGRELLKHYYCGPEWLDALMLQYCERIALERKVDSLGTYESWNIEVAAKKVASTPARNAVTSRLISFRHFASRLFENAWICIYRLRSKNHAVLRRCLLRARIALDNGMLETARAELVKGTDFDLSKLPFDLHMLCSLFYDCGSFQEVRKLLNRYSDIVAQLPGLALLKAQVLMHHGKYESALDILTSTAHLSKNDWWANFLRGICSVQIGETENAQRYFRRAARSGHHLATERLGQTLALI